MREANQVGDMPFSDVGATPVPLEPTQEPQSRALPCKLTGQLSEDSAERPGGIEPEPEIQCRAWEQESRPTAQVRWNGCGVSLQRRQVRDLRADLVIALPDRAKGHRPYRFH